MKAGGGFALALLSRLLWRNRIARPTSNREVAGSIPAKSTWIQYYSTSSWLYLETDNENILQSKDCNIRLNE